MAFNPLYRAFKTGSFAKGSKKVQIKDVELCMAIQQVLLGQVDGLDSDGQEGPGEHPER